LLLVLPFSFADEFGVGNVDSSGFTYGVEGRGSCSGTCNINISSLNITGGGNISGGGTAGELAYFVDGGRNISGVTDTTILPNYILIGDNKLYFSSEFLGSPAIENWIGNEDGNVRFNADAGQAINITASKIRLVSRDSNISLTDISGTCFTFKDGTTQCTASSGLVNTNISYLNNTQVFAGLNNFSQRVFINPSSSANYNSSLIIGRNSPQTTGGIMGKAFTVYGTSSEDNGTTPFKAGFVSEYENTQTSALVYQDTSTGAWFRIKNLGNGNQSTMRGVMTQSEYAGTGSISNVIGGYFAGQRTGIGKIQGSLIGGNFYVSNGGGNSLTNARIVNIEMPYADATNTITNLYGVYISALNRTGTINPWGLYQEGANEKNYIGGRWTGIGTSTFDATTRLTIVGNTSVTGLLQLKTIAIPTCSATLKNMIAANATGTYGCNSTVWVRLF
jgi:hypothetical protein